MDIKLFGTVFVTIFLAELGDKTQVATLLYASDATHAKLTVFFGAASALALSAGLGVVGGGLLGSFASPRTIRVVAAIGFIAMGAWMLLPSRASA